MAGGNGPNNSGRVTTAQFYEALLDTNDRIAASDKIQSEERAAMEIRLLEKLDGLPNQVETNKDEITRLRNSSNAKDWGLLLISVVGNAIAAVIGSRQ